jgi:hypothetical protein
MATQGGYGPPPGTGHFNPERDDQDFMPGNHMDGWKRAVDAALDNIGGAPGRYLKSFTFSAVVDVDNPGNIVEYIVRIN